MTSAVQQAHCRSLMGELLNHMKAADVLLDDLLGAEVCEEKDGLEVAGQVGQLEAVIHAAIKQMADICGRLSSVQQRI